MCDTFAIHFKAEGQNRTWFGKNSDREPNEAHEVVFIKGKASPVDTLLQCTYIALPQVGTTYDVILCKPVWMWGAEMGINQHGVVIGNEAVFTNGPQPKSPALTGMDLLRLALERSSSAGEALNCITTLLAIYGQGGNCGYKHPFYYNNSFLITDRSETWVLETVGREWTARRFDSLISISNALTIAKVWDLASPGVKSGIDFASSQSDKIMSHFSEARNRRSCVLQSLQKIKPGDSIQKAFQSLRSHGDNQEIPTGSLSVVSVCMHAGFGPIRINQTTGSMVVEMTETDSTVWITGTSAPCLSVFRPVKFEDFHEDTTISSEATWRDNEIFHRQILFCKKETLRQFSGERDYLESSFIDAVRQGDFPSNMSFKDSSREFENQKIKFIQNWTEKVSSATDKTGSVLFRKAWDKFNREGGFPLPVL
jgi:dipeptidase